MKAKRLFPARQTGREPVTDAPRYSCEGKVIVIGQGNINWRRERYGENWRLCTFPANVEIDEKVYCSRHAGEVALAHLLGEEDPFQ